MTKKHKVLPSEILQNKVGTISFYEKKPNKKPVTYKEFLKIAKAAKKYIELDEPSSRQSVSI